MITPSVPNPDNVILGDGVLYYNYGEGTELELGACRGDSVFNVDRQYREIDYNGSNGPTKDLKVKTKVIVTMKIALLELSPTNMVKVYQGLSSTDNTTYYTLTESLAISSSDYWTNLAFVGETVDGLDIIVKLYNVLGDGALGMNFKTKDDVVVDTTFTAHYDRTTPTTVPYDIDYYKSA